MALLGNYLYYVKNENQREHDKWGDKLSLTIVNF